MINNNFFRIFSYLVLIWSIFLPKLAYGGGDGGLISAGEKHTCALYSDGSVACWGRNNYGESTPLTGTFSQVSAGSSHTCGIKTDGSVVCWGSGYKNNNTPLNGTFTQVSTGNSPSVCGIKTDGSVACWGGDTPPAGTFNQVSVGISGHACGVKTDGSVACWGNNSNGQSTPPTGTFSQVSAGQYHTCGVKTDGSVTCWGANSWGQSTPPTGTFSQVSAGGFHTCGIKSDGSVACWGQDGEGESTPPAGTFSQVSAGGVNSLHTCGIKVDGSVVCWGDNNEGQSTPPTGTFNQISTGNAHACAVRTGGSVACWGQDSKGESTPPAGIFNQVSTGNLHTCGVKSDASVACWGYNSDGQSTSPAGTFSQISAGSSHTCGVKSDGSVACWGDDSSGQSTPPAGTFSQISAGSFHTCGVKSDASVACWGDDSSGQSTPPAGTFSQVSAGSGSKWSGHTCGIKTDGSVACWGQDVLFGELTPPTGTFSQISSGNFSACGVKSSQNEVGKVVCWGTEGQSTPLVGTFSQVSVGSSYICGIKVDGSVVCEGNNLGTQTPPTNQSPVQTVPTDVQIVTVGTPLIFSTATNNAITVTDDAQVDNPVHLIKVSLTVTEGTLTLATTAGLSFLEGSGSGDTQMTFTGTLAPINIALDGLIFEPLSTITTSVFASLQITTNDQGHPFAPSFGYKDTDTISITILFSANYPPNFTANDPPAVDENSGSHTISNWITAFNPGATTENNQTVLAYNVSNISKPELFTTLPTVTVDGTLSYTLASNVYGTTLFQVTAQDNGGTAGGGIDTSVPQRFTLVVNPIFAAPVLNPIGDQSVNLGETVTFTASATSEMKLTFSLAKKPQGATIDSGTGKFRWEATKAGTFHATIVVTDENGASDQQQIIISVDNTAPILEPIDDQTVAPGELIHFTAKASDAEDTDLTFSLQSTPSGASLNPSTGEFMWQTTEVGQFPLTVTVTDSGGLKASENVILIVSTDPILAPIGNQITLVNQPVTFIARATHPSGNPLQFSLINSPTEASINPNTGEFSWTPTTSGIESVTVVVTEIESNTNASQTLTITVEKAYTQLILQSNSEAIFLNGSLDIYGQLMPYPSASINQQPIELRITAPDGMISFVTTSTDTTGAFTFSQLSAFEQTGQYFLQAHFVGNEALHESTSIIKLVHVQALAGYALLIQGRTADGSGLETHNKSLNRVYRNMKTRGFLDENIEYLNYNTNQSQLSIEVDGIPNQPEIQSALQRLQAKMNANPAPLFIVMVDHGGVDGSFHLDNGDGEKIMPTELNSWLNELENNLNPKALAEPRVAILGSCYSGSFIPTLSKPGRVIVTSTATDEESYKGPKEPDEIRSGEFFMEALFAQLGRGHSLKNAFELATQTTEILTQLQTTAPFNLKYQDRALQHPLLDDNHDRKGSNVFFVGDDGLLAQNIYLGLGPKYEANAANNSVEIWQVTPNQYLGTEQTTAELFATVNNPMRVMGNQVFVDIRSPEIVLARQGIEQPEQLEIEGLQRTILTPVNSDRFTGQFAQFQTPGKYELLYFALDKETFELSPLKRSFVYKNETNNHPPYPFELLTPINQSTTATNLILNWEDTFDPDGHEMTYTLILASDSDFQQIVYLQNDLSLSMSYLDENTLIQDALNPNQLGLRDGTTYYWKVEAIDQFGAITTSPTFSFTTNNTNAPPSIASFHVSSAVNFTDLDSAVIDFWQVDMFGNPILDAFGNPIPVVQPPVIHQEPGFYNMLLPFGRRRVTINQPGMAPQEFDLDNTNGQTKLILKESNTQERIIELASEDGFKNLNFAMQPIAPVTVNHGQLQFSVNQTRLDENQASLSLIVNRTGGSDGNVSVSYTTIDGSASAENDYQTANGILTWADKETLSKRIPLTLLNDSEFEGDEYFTLLLYDPTGGAELGQNQQIRITIADQDEENSDSESQEEENSDAEIQEEENSDSESQAEENSDAESQEEGNSDSESQSEGTLLLPPPGDEGQGRDEGYIQFSSPTYTTSESDGIKTITVTRTGDNPGEISALYFTSSKSTATEGSDYIGEFGTLTWASNDLQPKVIEIEIIDDTKVEEPETIHFLLFNVTGNTGTLAQTTLTIIDNDRATTTQEPIVSTNSTAISTSTETTLIEPATVQFMTDTYITEEGVGLLTTLTVTRQGSNEGEIAVQYAPTHKSTATLDTDYTGGTGTLVWADGDMQPKPITLTLVDDENIEGAEVIEIALSNLTGNVKLGETKRTVLIMTDNEEIFPSIVEPSSNTDVQLNEEVQANSVDLQIYPTSEDSEIEKLDLPSLGDGVILQKPPLPDLGFGVVIVNENSSRTTLCSQETCEVNTIFRGGVSLNGWDYQNFIQITPFQKVWIEAEIEVDAEHVGQSADILMGALYTPSQAQILPWWLIKDEQWGIVWWDGELDHLLAASDNVTLTPTQTVNIYQGPISDGYFQIFFGYQLTNGTIVFNGEQAIEIVVQF